MRYVGIDIILSILDVKQFDKNDALVILLSSHNFYQKGEHSNNWYTNNLELITCSKCNYSLDKITFPFFLLSCNEVIIKKLLE